MQTNFFAAPRATRAAVPAMLNQGAGSIVNIASTASLKLDGDPGQLSVSARSFGNSGDPSGSLSNLRLAVRVGVVAA
jgi:NAD(P)-dependent dehydrogenase (short-subunit alcohol dehydrogenase family)